MLALRARLTSVGATGTNGKTSTTRWTAACLARLARPVAQTTTLGSFLDDEPFDAPPDFTGFLSTMRAGLDRGGRFASIELTSEALARGFARAWPCQIAVFTNLSHDHLDAHRTPEHYLASKAQLFVALPPNGVAVLNAADPASELLVEVVPKGVRVLRYAVPRPGALHAEADIIATSVDAGWHGTRISVEAPRRSVLVPAELQIRAIGDIYAENALAAMTAALAVGVPAEEIAAALARAPVPPGRFEVFGADTGPRIVVDYAHTPDALARTIAVARRLTEGTLTVVFGAGGDRDRAKRAPMGAAASGADRVVLTSDSPRMEKAESIAASIRAGVAGDVQVEVLLDRRAAIRTAVLGARRGDVVLVAGKGHETEQHVAGRVLPFDDRAEVRAALNEYARSGSQRGSPT